MVPLDLRHVAQLEHFPLFVGDETHSAGVNRAGSVLGVQYRQLFPLLRLHVYTDHLVDIVTVFIDSTHAQHVLVNQNGRDAASLRQETLRVVPGLNWLELPRVRVELNDLVRAVAHLMHFAVAEPTEEVVQLALVGARAHSKDALHVGQASLRVGSQDTVLRRVLKMVSIEHGHVCNWALAKAAEQIELCVVGPAEQ